MKLIVITPPEFIDNESMSLRFMLDNGVDYIHIRKPAASSEEVQALINAIGPKYYSRLAVHYHHDIAIKLNLGGLHLSGRCPSAPESWKGRISKSCHTLEEVASFDGDYCFLSPIFDSISKSGYNSRFTEEVLKKARLQGLINEKVIALGGIKPCNIHFLRSLGFGGVAILGGIWNASDLRQATLSYIKEIKG